MYVGVGTPPPPARQVGQRQPKPPSRHGDQGGGGGGWANGLPCHPPPHKAIFFPPRAHARARLSTGWALNRCFAWTFGTATVLAQGGWGGEGHGLKQKKIGRCLHTIAEVFNVRSAPTRPSTCFRVYSTGL